MLDNRIINFENALQKAIYQDFLGNLALVCLHNLVEVRKELTPNFDAEAFKKNLIEKWCRTQMQVLNNQTNIYAETSSLVNMIAPEDIQQSNKNTLTKVQKLIESVLLV